MIHKLLITVLFTTYCFCFAKGQVLYGEGHLNRVKLAWIPKSWPSTLIGWDLKRQKDAGAWVKLNKEIIKPQISSDKDFAFATNSISEQNRLTEKQRSLMISGHLKEKGTDDFLRELNTEDGRFGVAFLSAMDYDLALIMGFAFVDEELEGKGDYRYALFQRFNDATDPVLIAEFSWKYGTVPTINVPMEGSVKKYNTKGNELVFRFKKNEYEAINPLGVNLYRKEENSNQYEKLNQRPILVNTSDEDIVFTYLDKEADQTIGYTYALAPVTVFQTEGAKSEVIYIPTETNANIKGPILMDPVLNKSALILKWNFEKSQEEFIQGFYVQLKIKDGFKFYNVSGLLNSSVRSFNYGQLPTPDNDYYHIKIVAIKNDDLELWSNRKIFFNKKATKPSAPVNLQAEVITSENETQIRLSWQPPAQNAQSVQEYYIYTSNPNQEKVVKEGSIGSITEENWLYPVYRDRAATYNFAVSAVNDQNEESELSDQISILVPSKSLPFIEIWPIGKEENEVTLNWKYDSDIADLAGFRLFQNDELIADEEILDRDSRQWKSAQLGPGQYTYEIIAVTLTDVQSERSKARKFSIE